MFIFDFIKSIGGNVCINWFNVLMIKCGYFKILEYIR